MNEYIVFPLIFICKEEITIVWVVIFINHALIRNEGDYMYGGIVGGALKKEEIGKERKKQQLCYRQSPAERHLPLDDPEPSLLPCPLERRREAAADGLSVKALDGEGRGQVNEPKPECIDPSQTPLRRSARRLAAANNR